MKLKTATLIAIVGLVLNLLYVIGHCMFMAHAHGALQWQCLVSPILFHGSLLIFLVVLYQKQVDHNTRSETVTSEVKPDKPPSAATAIQPGLIVYAASSTFFVLGATALFGVFLALCDCNFNHWADLGECHMVPSLGGTAVILWVVSLVLGLIAARHRPSVWWWTGPLVAIALAAIIGLPARYFWLEHQNKANQVKAPTAVPVAPVETTPAPTAVPIQYDPKHINDVNELRKKYKLKISQSGLIAYYPFNGNATDESGNNNNGTVFGAILVADRHGIGNSAYRFDGNSGYIDCGNAQILKIAGKGMTISVWININGNGRNWGRIVLGGAVNTSYTLCKSDPEDRILWRLTGIGEITSSVLDRNKWHHVVASYDGVKMSIDIDGNLNVSSNAQGNIYTNSKSIVIGGEDENHGGMSSCFDGVIDDVIIYNRALPPEEISLLYKEY